MKTIEYHLKTMEIIENRWISMQTMEIIENQWKSMKTNGGSRRHGRSLNINYTQLTRINGLGPENAETLITCPENGVKPPFGGLPPMGTSTANLHALQARARA